LYAAVWDGRTDEREAMLEVAQAMRRRDV